MRTQLPVLLTVYAALAGCTGSPARASGPQPPALFDAAWARHWQDGKAELAGYTLTQPRYGQLRRGTAVTITVTEPFNAERGVKADDAGPRTLPVLKLNLVQDFQTGIYDYNLMTSVFVATQPMASRPTGSAVKVSFGAQEWCGQVYSQVRFAERAVALDSHSYFETEADERRELPRPEHGITEDALLLWARGLAWPPVAAGEQRTVPLLRSLQRVRLGHTRLQWDEVTLSCAAAPKALRVPAGEFTVQECSARIVRADTRKADTLRFFVEAAQPRRLIAWEADDGLRAELRGATRLPYWQLNSEGHDKHLRALGL